MADSDASSQENEEDVGSVGSADSTSQDEEDEEESNSSGDDAWPSDAENVPQNAQQRSKVAAGKAGESKCAPDAAE